MTKLCSARTSLGLSQRQLAAQAGISHTAVNLLESGWRPRSSRVIEALAEFLGIPAESLLNEEESGP